MRKPSDKTEIDREHINHKMPADDFSSAGMNEHEKSSIKFGPIFKWSVYEKEIYYHNNKCFDNISVIYGLHIKSN